MATRAEAVPARGGRAGDTGTRNTQPHNHSRGSKRGGRGGRGGIKRGRGQAATIAPPRAPPPAPPPVPNAQQLSPTVGTSPNDSLEKAAQLDKSADEELEAEICFICASPVVHQSLAPCSHRTCHICSLRLRALYKTRACAHCRVSSRYSSI